MAIGSTTADIVKAILRNCGELDNQDSPFHLTALDYLNKFNTAFHSGSVMFDLDFGGVWSWAKEQNPGVLVLVPPYKTGSITLVKGSNAGVFTTPPSESYVGWFIKVDNRPEVFRIKNHATPFADFELDSIYTDESGTLGFTCFKTDYDLVPNVGQKILRLVTPFSVYRSQCEDDSGHIYGMEFLAYKKKYPIKHVMQGIPTRLSEIRDVDGLKTIRFNKYPDTETRVEYEFVQYPNPLTDSDESIPSLPLEGRNAIEYAATYKLMLDKDDDRAEKYLQLAQASLASIRSADRKEAGNMSGNRGRLIPRPEQVGNRSDRDFY